MNKATKASSVHPNPDDSRIWYPLHPRWIPLLRFVGILGLLCAVYNAALQWPWSFSSLTRSGIPVLLILSCLFIQPELRVPTVLNRIGSIAHLLLVFVVLPLAVVAFVLYWLRA